MAEGWREEKRKLVEKYRLLNQAAEKGGIVFTGSSLMEMLPVEEFVSELPASRPLVYNRGVGGYRTADLLPIVDVCAWELQPRKVFINIGTNDLSDAEIPIAEMISRYDRILEEIESHVPGVRIYLMAYYPVNPDAAAESMKACLRIRTNEKIRLANEKVQKLADKHHQRYIDLNAPLTDNQGRLKAEYTLEGMHINREGYRAIWPELLRYILE